MQSFLPRRYEAVGPIGAGATSTVLHVRDLLAADGEVADRALKILTLAWARAAPERFRAEFAILSSLRHPGLARVYDYGHLADGRPYYTAELVTGSDATTRAGSVTIAEACAIAASLCRVLDLLGSRGLLHNDLKPSNVIVAPSGEVTLVDLGLCSPVGERVDAGTLAYMAPERLRGDRPDARADLFSLGVTLFRLLAGELPFRGASRDELCDACGVGAPPLRALRQDCPAGLEELVGRLCAFDRTSRPARPADVLDQIAAAGLGRFPLEAPGVGEAYALSSIFVGREPELDELAGGAIAAAGERRGLTVVLGPAGSGKSRLLDEARRRLQLAGGEAFTVRCRRHAGAFAPMRDLARFALASTDTDAATRSAVGFLDDLAADDPRAAPPAWSGAEQRQTIARTLAATLAAAARVRPLALFVDDADLADDGTLDTLDALARPDGAGAPTLRLAVGIREERMPDSLRNRVEVWRATGRAHVLRLAPLARPALRRLLESLYGADVFAAADASWVLDRSVGAPLVVVEIARALFANGGLTHAGGRWRLAADWKQRAGRTSGSDALASLLGTRLAALPRGARTLVEALAVLRMPAANAVLSALTGLTAAAVDEGAAELGSAGLVARESAGLALFHESLTDAALASMPPRRLRALHRAAAAALEAQATPAAERARHLTAARDPRGFAMALAAADQAIAVGDVRGVVELLVEATPLAPKGRRELALRRRFHERLGECLAATATAERAAAELGRALALPGGRPEDHARIIGKAALAYIARHQPAEAAAWLARSPSTAALVPEHALAALRLLWAGERHEAVVSAARQLLDELDRNRRPVAGSAAQARALRTQAETILAANLIFLGRLEEARPALERALAQARAHGSAWGEFEAENHLGMLEVCAGHLGSGLPHFRRALELARGAGRESPTALTLANLGETLAQRGELPEAETCLRESLAIWRRIRANPSYLAWRLGAVLLLRGDRAEATRLLDEVVALRRAGDSLAATNASLWLCVDRFWRGEHRKVAALAARLAKDARASRSEVELAAALCAEGLAAASAGDPDGALVRLDEARASFARSPQGLSAASECAAAATTFLRAEVMAAAGRSADARHEYAATARALEALDSPLLAARVAARRDALLGSRRAARPDDGRRGQRRPPGGDPATALLELTVGVPIVSDSPSATALVGESAAMLGTARLIQRFAATDLPVVVLGETGTGKELVARALHAGSPRAARAFVPINCAAIPAAIADRELFGHVRGAFTGATEDRPGVFQEADGGTLFLDEIGEMDLALQARLLRALEDGEVRPVGSAKARHVNVRVVAATNRDLAEGARTGRFRLDLYHRLAAVELRLPPLRDRMGDLPLLVRCFLGEPRRAGKRPRKRLVSESALAALSAYAWPGNVRELQNEILRAQVLAGDGPILLAHLSDRLRAAVAAAAQPPPARVAPPTPRRAVTAQRDPSLKTHVAASERAAILDALDGAQGNRSRAAGILGVSRRTLYNKLRAYGLM